jgi:hypothetical protein
MKPPRSVLDPTFTYVPASHTNIRETFARVRREQSEARKAEAARVVTPIMKRSNAK